MLESLPNRLAASKSAYMLAHASQPVAWQPWDEQAVQHARDTDRPIFLSLGHAQSQICKTLSESLYCDESIAQALNKHFVCIKVDRQERADLDYLLQTTLRLMGEQPQWPMTLFLEPSTLMPFFGGSYFPRDAQGQLPGFGELIEQVLVLYRDKRSDIEQQCGKLIATLQQLNAPVQQPQLSDAALMQITRDALREEYDSAYGGFGNGQKSFACHRIQFLLGDWAAQRQVGVNDKQSLDHALTTLTQIARGGVYDHVGGGFFRFAKDRKWQQPHWDKCLSDNAQLLHLYATALRLGPDPLFAAVVRDSIKWLQREMQDSSGAYAYAQVSAQPDYYLWQRREVKQLLDEDEYLLIETLYGLDKPANTNGRWTLFRRDAFRGVVERLSMQTDAAEQLLTSALSKLLRQRGERSAPNLDATLNVGWNAVLAGAMATASQSLQEPAWLLEAQRLMDKIRTDCWCDGILSWTFNTQGGETDATATQGLLQQYAYTLCATLDLLEVAWRECDVVFAIELANAMLAQFEDSVQGGFFMAAASHQPLAYLPKPTLDSLQIPGNAAAFQGLWRLGMLLGKQSYLDAAARAGAWLRAYMEQAPTLHTALIGIQGVIASAPDIVILRGPTEAASEWQTNLKSGLQIKRTCYAIPYERGTTLPAYLPALISSDSYSKVSAFVYRDGKCSAPINTIEALRDY